MIPKNKIKSDINFDSLLIKFTSNCFHPYINLSRLDRPVGYLLLWIPTLWGLFAGNMQNNDSSLSNILFYAVLFLFGSIVMRGAGCTWNDITDIKFDKNIERTKNRPLANGQLSKRQAYIYLVIQLLLGASVLFFLPTSAIIASLIAIIPATIYPFMKRFTYWPQAWLGITFNWGIWVGWFAIGGQSYTAPILLHLAGIFWTLAYDTIYAHQDKDDDLLIGVKSSALRLGKYTKIAIAFFYSTVIILFFITAKSLDMNSAFIYPLSITSSMFAMYVYKLDINNSDICLDLFKRNWRAGIILSLALALGGL